MPNWVPRLSRVTVGYSLAVLAGVWFVWAILSLPVLLRLLMRWIGYDPLWRWFGVETLIGDRKILGGKILAGIVIALCTVGWLVLVRHRQRLLRLVVLLAAIPVIAASAEWLDSIRTNDIHVRVYDSFRRLHIASVSVRDPELFAKHVLPLDSVRSFDDLHEIVQRRFMVNRGELQRDWAFAGPELLRPAFYMNAVSGLFDFGNAVAVDRVGCVGLNEETGWEAGVLERFDAKAYLESNIGCCDDYAHLLKHLLDRAGLENRLVHIPGHIFNEVKADGAWRTLDPTVNVYYSRTWGDMVLRRGRGAASAILFPVHGLDPGDSFRPELGRLRSYLLFLASDGALTHFRLRDTLPATFRAVNDRGRWRSAADAASSKAVVFEFRGR